MAPLLLLDNLGVRPHAEAGGVEAMDRRRFLLALAAAIGTVLAGPTRRSAEAYNSSTWYEDAGGFELALRQQRALHAPVLVYFRVDWCPHCRALDQVLETYEVRSRLNEFIKVRANLVCLEHLVQGTAVRAPV